MAPSLVNCRLVGGRFVGYRVVLLNLVIFYQLSQLSETIYVVGKCYQVAGARFGLVICG